MKKLFILSLVLITQPSWSQKSSKPVAPKVETCSVKFDKLTTNLFNFRNAYLKNQFNPIDPNTENVEEKNKLALINEFQDINRFTDAERGKSIEVPLLVNFRKSCFKIQNDKNCRSTYLEIISRTDTISRKLTIGELYPSTPTFENEFPEFIEKYGTSLSGTKELGYKDGLMKKPVYINFKNDCLK